MKTIAQLRAEGWKIRVNHLRYAYVLDENNPVQLASRKYIEENGSLTNEFNTYSASVIPWGGRTMVEITDPNGKTATAHADCSLKDNYDRKVGRTIALGRAFKELEDASN